MDLDSPPTPGIAVHVLLVVLLIVLVWAAVFR